MINHPAAAYVGPFLIFMVFLAGGKYLPIAPEAEQILRFVVIAAAIWYFSRHLVNFKMKAPVASIGLGVAVFLLWIGPDALIPGYRAHWLFQNPITGTIQVSMPPGLREDRFQLILRLARAALLVPILEELFWRGWLMRWLIETDFEKVPLGAYALGAFWITAILFASEHGPYWEVGLITGAIYNWWMIRTKSLPDLYVTHGVTNLCLSLYVIATGKWEYWM